MKKLLLLRLILIAMAAIIAGVQGCASTKTDYWDSSKGYNTYDYQGNRLERGQNEWHLNRGFDRY